MRGRTRGGEADVHARPAPRACAPPPPRSSPARCPRQAPCSRSPSASPAPSTDRRWWSWSRGSSRSTRPTARASAAPGWARRWRSTRSCSCPTRRCRSPQGAIAPWSNSASGYYEQVAQAIAERYGVDLERPLGGAGRGGSRPVSARDERRAAADHLSQPLRAPALVRDEVRGDRVEPAAPLLARRNPRGRKRRSSSTCRCAPVPPAAARGCARSHGRCSSRARGSRTSPRCRRAARCSGWTRSSSRRPTVMSRG